MNIDPRTDDADIRKTILHEFGHALGCVHEHQSPVQDIPWRKDLVYRYYYENCKWTQSVVDHNVFNRHDANAVANTSFDPESIMMYEVPAELTITGASFLGGSHISKKDKELIRKMYPLST
jgi:serralysin